MAALQRIWMIRSPWWKVIMVLIPIHIVCHPSIHDIVKMTHLIFLYVRIYLADILGSQKIRQGV